MGYPSGTPIDATMKVNQLPAMAVCPFRADVDLFGAADTTTYGVPIWITGYSYCARVDDQPNAFGAVLKPQRIAKRRGGSSGILWCDTLTMLRAGGADQGHSFYHHRAKLEFNPATGTLLNAHQALLGQHRGWSDGSVEWMPGLSIDVDASHVTDSCSYRVAIPGAIEIWYYF